MTVLEGWEKDDYIFMGSKKPVGELRTMLASNR